MGNSSQNSVIDMHCANRTCVSRVYLEGQASRQHQSLHPSMERVRNFITDELLFLSLIDAEHVKDENWFCSSVKDTQIFLLTFDSRLSKLKEQKRMNHWFFITDTLNKDFCLPF
jgi:hypothetical protein